MARTVGSAADETRQRILDISVDLFIEQGYAGTSVRDIAERLGMTKGSLYYHFASKEDVLKALVAPLLTDLEQFVADARAAPRIDRPLIERLVNLLDKHGVLVRSLMGDPSVMHGLAGRREMKWRIAALQRSLASSDDPDALLRGRCALGVINAATIAPRFDVADSDGSADRERVVRAQLSEPEKRLVVEAALAVLSVTADR
ncbi:MAG TPA: helix-turn-helix domain-containing protein [Micromonosporaceae bacterium]|nr:helix-turn-helix domain-containing protein [Micromonosporaceae bacterium]